MTGDSKATVDSGPSNQWEQSSHKIQHCGARIDDILQNSYSVSLNDIFKYYVLKIYQNILNIFLTLIY